MSDTDIAHIAKAGSFEINTPKIRAVLLLTERKERSLVVLMAHNVILNHLSGCGNFLRVEFIEILPQVAFTAQNIIRARVQMGFQLTDFFCDNVFDPTQITKFHLLVHKNPPISNLLFRFGD